MEKANISVKSDVEVYADDPETAFIVNPAPAAAAAVTFDGVDSSEISGFTITGADWKVEGRQGEEFHEELSAVYITGSIKVTVANDSTAA